MYCSEEPSKLCPHRSQSTSQICALKISMVHTRVKKENNLRKKTFVKKANTPSVYQDSTANPQNNITWEIINYLLTESGVLKYGKMSDRDFTASTERQLTFDPTQYNCQPPWDPICDMCGIWIHTFTHSIRLGHSRLKVVYYIAFFLVIGPRALQGNSLFSCGVIIFQN